MKEVFKIVLTNWINIIAIFIVVYIAGFISAIIRDKFTVSKALYGTTYSVLGYGIVFWIGFFILISLFDFLLFSFDRQPKYTTYKLAVEWLVISSPFIYWFIRYNQWVFLVAVLAFLLGQYIRRPYVFKILE